MKIVDHEEKKLIEEILLKNAILGNGSPTIENELKSVNIKNVNRVEITKYLKEIFHIETIKKTVESLKANFESEGGDIRTPRFDDASAKAARQEIEQLLKAKIKNQDSESEKECTSLIEVYALITGLVQGNIQAHLEGKETLKLDYLKYLKEIRQIIDTLS